MYSSRLLALATICARAALAQTPQGWSFTPSVTNNLGITYANNNEVTPAGEMIPRPGLSWL